MSKKLRTKRVKTQVTFKPVGNSIRVTTKETIGSNTKTKVKTIPIK